jgi:hypothetical protein
MEWLVPSWKNDCISNNYILAKIAYLALKLSAENYQCKKKYGDFLPVPGNRF